MKIKITRKKQLASALVPFYIVINMDKDEIIKKVKNGEEVTVYPINRGETIILNSQENKVKIICMNGNLENSKIYPWSFSEYLEIVEDSTLLLEQTKMLKTVEIKLSIINKLITDEKNIEIYEI